MWKKIRNAKFNRTEYFTLILIVILLVAQIIFTNQNMNEQYIRVLNDTIAISSLKQLHYEDGTYISLCNLAATIYSDPDVLNQLESDSTDFISKSVLAQKLRKYATIAGNVNNVYLYNGKRDTIFDINMRTYVAGSEYKTDLFGELQKPIRERDKIICYSEKNDSLNQTNYINYIFSLDAVSPNAIIIEIDAKALEYEYTQYQRDVKNRLFVTNESGDVIFGGGDFIFDSNVASEVFFKNRKENIYYLGEYNGEKSIFFYHYSTICNRWFITSVPYNLTFKDRFLNTQFIYLYISLIISILVLLRVFVWIKKVSQHIEMIRNNARIKNDKVKEDSNSVRQVLYDYAYNPTYVDGEKIEEMFSGVFEPKKYTVALCVRIDNFNDMIEEYSYKDLSLYYYGIDNIISELFQQFGVKIYNLSSENENMEFLLGNISHENLHTKFKDICQNCVGEIENYIGAKTSYFLSDCFRLNCANECFRQVLECREYKFLYGSEIILDASVIKEDNDEEYNELMHLCENMKNCILKNENCETDILEVFMKSLYKVSLAQAREALRYLMLNIHFALENMKKHGNVVLSDFGKNIGVLESSDDVFVVERYLLQLLNDISNQLKKNSDKKLYLIVEKCMKIIKNNYPNSEFCINEIAEQLNLSVNYLGRIFKQVYEVSIADAITEQRIMAAKDLLINTDETVKDIAMRCGFRSGTSYFFAIFKNRFNETPTEFRTKYKNNKV